jgi:hypothetical protein
MQCEKYVYMYNYALCSYMQVECSALATVARFRTQDYLTILQDIFPNVNDENPSGIHSDKVPSLKTLIMMSR